MSIDFQEQITTKTDVELIDIYINQEDYQEGFVNAVAVELVKRNVSPERYQQKRKEKEVIITRQLEEGIPGDQAFIALAFIAALLGGFIGIIAGYIYGQSKKDGHYVYDEKTRKYGNIILAIGVFVFLATIAWRLDKG
jgi:hypothetical protein